ncbi:MAG: hypothetical protein INH37_11670 [Myxococcaceae bacterium]|nr:hypothetical protein [Myxococcaceae bacterium]
MRERASAVALSLCGAVAVIWFVTALAGVTSGWALGPLRGAFGHSTLLRFATWALLAGLWLHPAPEGLVQRLGRRLAGPPGWALAATPPLFFAVFKVTQHLSFRTAGFDLSLYHWAVHRALTQPFFTAWGLERSYFS